MGAWDTREWLGEAPRAVAFVNYLSGAWLLLDSSWGDIEQEHFGS